MSQPTRSKMTRSTRTQKVRRRCLSRYWSTGLSRTASVKVPSPVRVCVSSPLMAISSESLQVLDQGALLRRGEGRPEEVPGVAVARHADVELGAVALRLGPGDDEAHLLLVVDVVAVPEDLGPVLHRLQQIGERRHRAVVQVRR